MIVVDSAVIVDALIDVDADEIRALLGDQDLHAPALLDYEVASALRGLNLGGHISDGRTLDALADYGDLRIARWADNAVLRGRAYELRRNLSAYDAAYVALAETLDAQLVTRDGRLGRSTGHAAAIAVV